VTADPDPGAAPELVVHPDAAGLAGLTAGRLLAALLDGQSARGTASVALTGGGAGTELLRQVAASPVRDVVDWSRVDVWWGDERFVGRDDPERNERQAREALLDHVPLEPARVHPVPAAGMVATPEDAAASYAGELDAAPPLDVLLLGVGPEAHVGSVFPESPAAEEGHRSVVGVRGCPKPPAERVTLTLPAMNRARQVWFLVTGADKAGAVALALSGAGPLQVPAAGVRGTARTLWLVDRAAAGRLPPRGG